MARFPLRWSRKLATAFFCARLVVAAVGLHATFAVSSRTMKLLHALIMLSAFLCIVWGPAVVIARRLFRRGEYAAMRALRFVLPAQLIVVLSLAVAGEFLDVGNPAAMLVAVIAATSLLGALALMALAAWARMRRR